MFNHILTRPTVVSRTLFLWLIGALTLTLNGCALFNTNPQTQITEESAILHDQHMAQLNNIERFSLKGRLGVMTKPKGFSGRVVWQHSPENDYIDVFSPLGGKVAYITKTPDVVTLTNNKGGQASAPDTETLTEKTLGFRLPLSGLSHWALGKPSGTGLATVTTLDNEGHIRELHQNGWLITYQDYKLQAGYALPRKVTLRTDTLVIKLIAEQWSDIATRGNTETQ